MEAIVTNVMYCRLQVIHLDDLDTSEAYFTPELPPTFGSPSGSENRRIEFNYVLVGQPSLTHEMTESTV